MDHSLVVLKSSRYGLIIILDPDAPFDKLRRAVAYKFRDSSPFFGEAEMVITFQGRTLTENEECQLVAAISDNSELKIACILDLNEETEEKQKKALVEALEKSSEKQRDAKLYRGILQNGEILEVNEDLIIFGNVNPGAKVSSAGSIFVFGNCMGTVCAGVKGDAGAVIAALTLKPRMLSIAGKMVRSAIHKNDDNGDYEIEPMIGSLDKGRIRLKKVSYDYLHQVLNGGVDG